MLWWCRSRVPPLGDVAGTGTGLHQCCYFDADAEELRAADSVCALGSLDWLSPNSRLSAFASSEEELLKSLHLAIFLTSRNLSFLIKEGIVRDEGNECGCQGDIPEDMGARRKSVRAPWGKMP